MSPYMLVRRLGLADLKTHIGVNALMSFNIGQPSDFGTMASSSLWQRFQRYLLCYRDLDFSLDISRMKFSEDFFEKMQPKIEKAFTAMRQLAAGAIANTTA